MSVDKLYEPEYLKQLAKNSKGSFKKMVSKLKNKKPRQLDAFMHQLHDEAFAKIDCLQCANCCKGLGPRIMDRDIDRVSKFLKIKATEFIQQYLRVDEDGDYVFKTMPCPFLMDDNYCSVYEQRPKACREYPHTNHSKMVNKLSLAVKNSETCPAVYYVLSQLQKTDVNKIK